jgi:hypothetical protein
MKNIAFKNGHVLVNAVPISHFSDDDDAIMFEKLADDVNYKVGADGHMIVSFSADQSGKCTLKLQPTSPSNKFLNALANLQKGGPVTFVPIQVLFQDAYRQDMAGGALAGCIVKVPDFKRGMDNSGNSMDWEIILERYDLLLGDPAFVGFAAAAAEAAAV